MSSAAWVPGRGRDNRWASTLPRGLGLVPKPDYRPLTALRRSRARRVDVQEIQRWVSRLLRPGTAYLVMGVPGYLLNDGCPGLLAIQASWPDDGCPRYLLVGVHCQTDDCQVMGVRHCRVIAG